MCALLHHFNVPEEWQTKNLAEKPDPESFLNDIRAFYDDDERREQFSDFEVVCGKLHIKTHEFL